jgi:hypothetical protein
MKSAISRYRTIGVVAVGMMIGHGQLAWAGWTGSMNGAAYGKASANATSSTAKSNAANSAVMTTPSAAIKPTTGYSGSAPLPSGASASTYSRIKGLAGYVWQASTVAANGDKTDDSELIPFVTPTSPMATTTLDVLSVSIDTNGCGAGQALYTFIWHWSGSDAGTAQQVKFYEFDGELPTNSDSWANADVGSLSNAVPLGDPIIASLPIFCDGPCPTNFDEVVTNSICGPADSNKMYMVTDGIAVSLPPPCINCNESTVVVDQNVTVNFNTKPPTYSGDPDLLPYFTFDTNGPTADTWKAIFDVGAAQLLVKSNATITVNTVPLNTNNRTSPGIVIKSTCGLETEPGSYITVGSLNRQAGDILIQVGGNITINGVVSNSVDGTRGRPGQITIGSDCGVITTGEGSRVITYGQDFGGSDINFAACGGGDIQINGLVDASYKSATPSTIRIASFDGSVVIVGTNKFGTEVVAGTKRTITSGVSVRSRRDPIPGTISIQADQNVVVVGSTLLSKKYPNYGAVAIKTASNSSKGGLIDARAINGSIIASDRAFDDANRYNAAAQINLQAGSDIGLNVGSGINDGASDNSKAVVSTQAGASGKGGTNLLRSFNGSINIGTDTQVLADFAGTPGANGANLLTACVGVNNAGTVSPSDANASDDSGVCGGTPDPTFLDCGDLGIISGSN